MMLIIRRLRVGVSPKVYYSINMCCQLCLYFSYFSFTDLFSKVWFRMNTVFPRKLWAITANHLNQENGLTIRKRITQDDLVMDPLQVNYIMLSGQNLQE